MRLELLAQAEHRLGVCFGGSAGRRSRDIVDEVQVDLRLNHVVAVCVLVLHDHFGLDGRDLLENLKDLDEAVDLGVTFSVCGFRDLIVDTVLDLEVKSKR